MGYIIYQNGQTGQTVINAKKIQKQNKTETNQKQSGSGNLTFNDLKEYVVKWHQIYSHVTCELIVCPCTSCTCPT